MAKNHESNLVAELYDNLSHIAGVKLEEGRLFVEGENSIEVAKEFSDHYVVYRVRYNESDSTFSTFDSPSEIRLEREISLNDLWKILQIEPGRYWFNHLSNVKKVLASGNSVRILDISSKHHRLSYSSKTETLRVPTSIYVNALSDVQGASKRSNTYKASVLRYSLNRLIAKYSNRSLQPVTSTAKGEFTFLMQRFNLTTKRSEADFRKYLDASDITGIQDLTRGMLAHGVFEPDFLRTLNDYLIRERLVDIIDLGRRLLALKTWNPDSPETKGLIAEVGAGEKIGQLETLWQRYFEKNLWYLIFSYKKIHSKIGLTIEGSTKYPDFVGVNHYNGIDIVEIKTHLAPALVFDASHTNFSFSPDLSKAIIQVTNYMDAVRQDAFARSEDRERLIQETNETNLYRPQGIIIISSMRKLVKTAPQDEHKALLRRDFTKLRNSLDAIKVLTFDEILDIADNYAKNILGEDVGLR